MVERPRSLNAGVIGLGVGEQHIAGYRSHKDCTVTTICDISPVVADVMRKRYPEINVTQDPFDVLRDPEIDVVSICSYDDAHRDQVVEALEHGKHVFIEKPLCLTFQHARDIRARLLANPRLKLSSNLILRKTPRFLLVKSMIDRGEFGNLFYLEGDYNYGRVHKIIDGWRGKTPGYSMMVGGGIHIVDLLLWLSGEKVTHVSACGNRIATSGSKPQFDDLTVALLKFESGLTAKIAANAACVHPHFHALTVYGTLATFRNGLGDGELFTSRDFNDPSRKITEEYPLSGKKDLIPEFVDSILFDTPPPVTVNEIFNSLAVCLAIDKASASGTVIAVESL